MIGLNIKPKKTLKALQLVRIQVPLADHGSEPETADGVIFRIDPTELVLRNVMEKIEALRSADLSFVAWPLDHGLIQIVCTKAVVAKLFKILFTQQRALGIRLTDLKSHVILTPMDPSEALSALSVDIFAALAAAGWHGLKLSAPDAPGRILLGVNPLNCADGLPHLCSRIEAHVGGTPDAPVLLLHVSTVRFRHNAIAAFIKNEDLAAASRAAAGTLCRVLPTATPGIIDRLRRAQGPEAASIEAEWARAGFVLPPGAAECVLDVRFDEDVDAPTTPFPAVAVLSFLGFDPVDTKISSPGVVSVLARLRDDLNGAQYRLWGPGGAAVVGARRWDPERPSTGRAAAAMALQPAAKLGAGGTANESAELHGMGPAIDLEGLLAGSNDGGGGGGQGAAAAAVAVRVKKQHARAGPELLAYLARLEAEEAKAAAAVAAAKPPPPPPRPTAPAPKTKNPAAALAAISNKKVPVVGSKRPGAGAGAAAKAPGAKKPAATKKAAGAAGTAAGGAAGGASAAPKAPRAPKAPAPEIDVAALEVPGLAAAGKLSSLTIPQLKAYCRSVKQPVGGKKGDLEARIRAHLGLAAPAGAAEA